MALKRNLDQQGIDMVSLTAGDGTLVITLDNPMPDTTFGVQLTFGATINATDGELWADTKTKLGFTINVTSGSANGSVPVNWKVSKVTQ